SASNLGFFDARRKDQRWGFGLHPAACAGRESRVGARRHRHGSIKNCERKHTQKFGRLFCSTSDPKKPGNAGRGGELWLWSHPFQASGDAFSEQRNRRNDRDLHGSPLLALGVEFSPPNAALVTTNENSCARRASSVNYVTLRDL